MRVIFAHSPESNARELRQILMGSGLVCESHDCVPWSGLPVRLGGGDADLVLVGLDQRSGQSWDAISGARALTAAPVMAIGARQDERTFSRLRELGVSEVLDETNLREALDDALERSLLGGVLAGKRGKVISVFAPTPGSGGTTVACNLAGELATQRKGRVALIELAKESSDMAVMLDMHADYSAGDVCRRWRTLDTTTLASSFTEYATGLDVLANDPECDNEHLDRHSTRRTAILTRVCRDISVLALEGRMTECELEAMRLSDVVALVVRPDVLAVRRAYRAINWAAEQGLGKERFQLVVNRYGQRAQLPLRQVESVLGLRAIALIPNDPRSVNSAMHRGGLAINGWRWKKLNRAFRAMAIQLLKRTGKQKLAATES
ncbi:MAG: hypothetical protein ABI614_00185 [Planctomycetota bacterium]